MLHYFTTLDDSLMERLQRKRSRGEVREGVHRASATRYMVNPQLPGGPPTMFICGNDDGAKDE